MRRVYYKGIQLVEERVRLSIIKGKGLEIHWPRRKSIIRKANKTNAPHSSITMPPQADSLIEMKLESLKISASGVEKRCRGSFTIRNVGPGYEESPTKIGPSYGVFIYDATGTMLFRNFGGWSGRNKSGDSITIGWNTNSNHLGETSEPAFLIPKPGTYELVIIVYPSKRDTMLCYATKKFNVGASMDSPAAPRSQISDKSEPLNVQVPEGLVAATKQQTNLVKNLKSLKKGMSMAEVKKVLGNPTKESADNLYYHLSESKIKGGYYVTATLRFEKSGLFEGKVGFGHETRSKRKQ
jgi:hypothetical protein